jgi:hypothetical protein
MQRYLFIGGHQDGLSWTVPDDTESTQTPIGRTRTGQETYFRESLSVGGASVTIVSLRQTFH